MPQTVIFDNMYRNKFKVGQKVRVHPCKEYYVTEYEDAIGVVTKTWPYLDEFSVQVAFGNGEKFNFSENELERID